MHDGRHADASSHYAVLGVKPSASTVDIRAAYLDQVRRYHPDKVQQLSGNPTTIRNGVKDRPFESDEMIRRVNQAYIILMDDATRAVYDRQLASSTPSNVTHPRISATVDFDTFTPTDTGDAVTLLFTYPCRCGSVYTLTEDQAHAGLDLVTCNGCSEFIQVHYDEL